MRVTSLFGSFVVLSLLTGSAFAQSDVERAAARNAASSGRAAYEAGDYEQAIESLSQAERLVHAPTHLLYLARAQAKLGKLVAARENYLKIARETLGPNAPKAFVDAQAAAQQERPALDARLPWITVAVHGAGAGSARVRMDGTELPSAMIGMRMPVDPGRHVFQASAAGADGASIDVTLAEGAVQTVTLSLVPTTGAAHTGVPAALAAGSRPSTVDSLNGKGSGLRVGSYASFGVGAVGGGLGTYFLLRSRSTRSDADSLYQACGAKSSGVCSDPVSKAQIESKDAAADHQRNFGVASLIVGGVAVASGVTLLVLDSGRTRAAAERAAPELTAVIGIGSVGVTGRF